MALQQINKVRLGSVKTILRPRGSMEKESIGLTIFERLESAIDWWTRNDYIDTPPLLETLATAKNNLYEEVEAAWNKLLSQFEKEAETNLSTFLSLIVIKDDYKKIDEIYKRITKSYVEFFKWINFCDNLRDTRTKEYRFFTGLHMDFLFRYPKNYPKYRELYEEVVKKKGAE
jgi:hypothetical protein